MSHISSAGIITDNPGLDRGVIPARLYDDAGQPLSPSHVFSVGDLKIIRPDGTISDAALPTPVVGAADGTFNVSAVDSLPRQNGTYRWQLSGTGLSFWEWDETT